MGILTVILGNSIAQEVSLKPPGLRPVKDPSIAIPTDQHYLNQPLNLPKYCMDFGKPAQGWACKTVETRRLASDQSAMIYYRIADLAQSHAVKTSNTPGIFRIWPAGTIIVLESYKGNINLPNRPELIAIDVIKKMNAPEGSSNAFYPLDWSYANFSPKGELSITSQKIKDCHQCHSIAFDITGDLVFTLFPLTSP